MPKKAIISRNFLPVMMLLRFCRRLQTGKHVTGHKGCRIDYEGTVPLLKTHVIDAPETQSDT